MKTCLVTYKINYGGVGTYLISLAKELEKNGHDVTLLCTDAPGTWYDKAGSEGIKTECKSFGILEWIPFGRYIHSIRIKKQIERGNYDWILINNSYFAQAAAGKLKTHSIVFNVIHNQLPSVVKGASINSKNADLYICISNKVYEEALKHIAKEKLVMIPNGIELPDEAVKNSREGHAKPFKMIYAGRIHHAQKGVFLLPEMLERLVEKHIDVRLTIIGDGEDRIKLMEKFRSKGLDSYVDYLGLMDHDEMYREFAKHHVLLFPSFFEGLPLTPLEAMSCGCVPIASFLPGCTDLIIKDNETGFLISPSDTGMFAEKIAYLYNKKEAWHLFSKASMEVVEKNFSVAAMTEKYQEQYEALVKKVSFERQPSAMFFSWKEIVPFGLLMMVKKIISKVK